MAQKVYIVNWFTAEPYEDWGGVHSVFLSHEKAAAFLEKMGDGPYEQDLEGGGYFGYGYYLSDIEEYEVTE